MDRFTLHVETNGDTDFVNLSPLLSEQLDRRQLRGAGLLHLFVAGSTAALTTVEYESGLIKHDLPKFFQHVAPDNIHYHHEATWHDDNGHSHVRAALIGPGLTVPIQDGKLMTGEWQQVILVDFDTSPRKRSVIATILP